MNSKASGESRKAQALTTYPHHGGVVTEAQRENLGRITELSHWFNWDPLKGSEGKLGKAPINFRTGGFGSVSKPETAGTLAQVVGAMPAGGGVGVLLSETPEGFVCLDLDHVIYMGVLHWLGERAIEFFRGSYIEVSPSGTGLRIFTRGVVEWAHGGASVGIIGPIKVGTCPSGVDINFEIYHSSPNKWARLTGALLIESAGVVAECQGGIDWVLGEMSKKFGPVAVKGAGSGGVKAAGAGGVQDMDTLFAQLGELRGDVFNVDGEFDLMGADEIRENILGRVLAQPRSKLAAAWAGRGDRSDADFAVVTEVLRSGAGDLNTVVEVWEASPAGRRELSPANKRGKVGDREYQKLTVSKALKAVLLNPPKHWVGVKGNRASDRAAVVALESTGGELARTTTGSVMAGFANIVQVLRHDPKAFGLFGHDLFKGRMYRMKSLVELDPMGEAEVGPVTDDDYRRVALYLHSGYGMSARLEDVRDAVKTVAKDGRFNPVRAALEKLGDEWDGVERLGGWLVKYLKIDTSVGSEYVRKVSRAMLLQSVERVLTPGTKADSMPVVIGPGGEGKGKAFKAMAGAVGVGLFTNGGFDMSSTRDIIEKCNGRLIVEAAEMDCVKRAKDVAAFKAAMTVDTDTHRKAYESEPEDSKRSFTLWGSSNDEEIITDATDGQGRRVWPLFTLPTRANPIDVKGIERDGGQIWGEAVRALKGGELAYFDENTDVDQRAVLEWMAVIERCRVPTPLDDALDLYLEEWATEDLSWWRSSKAVNEALGLAGPLSGKIDHKDFHIVTNQLKARKLRRKTLGNARGWELTGEARRAYLERAEEAGELSGAMTKALKGLRAVK